MGSEHKIKTTHHGFRCPMYMVALLLGLVSVCIALSISCLAYYSSVDSAEQQCQKYHLGLVKTIVADMESHASLSDEELLKSVQQKWDSVQGRPAGQYLCIVDRNSKLIFNTLYPETIGSNSGQNRIIGNRDCQPCVLQEMIESQEDYIGRYLPISGQEQIAAFISMPDRQWTVGVNCSRSSLQAQIHQQLYPLFIGLMVVCGVLMPASLFLMYRAFSAIQLKQQSSEKKREELLAMLDAKNKELQSLVYISSHDLKTPLVNIAGFSGMLEDHCQDLEKVLEVVKFDAETRGKIQSILNEDIREDLGFIRSGVRQVQMLLDGLLRVSRVGTAEILPQRLNMDHVLAELVDMVRFQCEEKQATITVDPLPDCICDLNQVHQVFSNLLDNALKYLDPDRAGRIHVSGAVQDDKVVYCVQDNGIGVEERYHQKIFDIYYRLDPSDSVQGEGLGLVIIRRILDRHGGEIWLESEFGKGSQFYVSLPYKERD